MCKQVVYYVTMLPLPPAETRHASRVSRFGKRRQKAKNPTTDKETTRIDLVISNDPVVASTSVSPSRLPHMAI